MKRKIARYSALLCAFLAAVTLSAQEYGTGAISTASGDRLYQTGDANLSNTFAGAFTGMAVMQGSGELGNNTAKWLVRGMGTFGVGSWSTAKIFVDGFEVNKEYMSAITPAEIEKVEVLSTASGAPTGSSGSRPGAAGKAVRP